MSKGNLLYGLYPYGKYIHAGLVGIAGGYTDDQIGYLPDRFDVIAYNKDGTKSAIFSSGVEGNALEKITFEIVDTGCGKAEFTFRRLPTNTELSVDQRIDIHLFNDPRPWWSGYILNCPTQGSTADSHKYTAHGYYNKLDAIVIFADYLSYEISEIVSEIARQAELKSGLNYNRNLLINTNYTASRIQFDGVTAKDALKQLSDFAIDYVYGVDEYRRLFFRPRNREVNEQARFWVGEHLNSFEPTEDAEKIYNVIPIKGAAVDGNGEQWIATVEDIGSQLKYGIREKVLTLPSAYSAADAERWGRNQLTSIAAPVQSAKVKVVHLEYPLADGRFNVRKMWTDGEAVITDRHGVAHQYPISKLKYTVSASDGIKCDMELGKPPETIDVYLSNLSRYAKDLELLQAAATKQLK